MRRWTFLLALLLVAVVAGCDDVRTEGPLLKFPSEEPTGGTTTEADAAPTTEPGQDDSAAPGATGDPSTNEDAGGGGDAQDDAGAGQDDGAAGNGEQAPGDEAAVLTDVGDSGPVGANAAAYLRGDRARVVIEVDSQSPLPDGVLGHLRSILERESNSAVELAAGAAVGESRDVWTTDQVRAAAGATRDQPQSDDQAVLHLLVLDGEPEQDGVLGYAFNSSTAVVFPDQWASLTGALLSGDRVSRAVTTHEMGHLLGLVGLYEEPVNDHEDGEHPGHTTDRNDVMFWAVESDAISQLAGDVPTDFGDLTRADLAAIREG